MPARFARGASVACRGPGVLDDLLVIARQLCRSRLDRQFAERAGKAERRLVVFVFHARPRIDSDVKRLINRHDGRNGVRDRLAGDFLAVNGQNARAALRLARAVIFEVKYDCVFARCERLWALPAEALQSQQVVGEDWLPLEQIEAVTAEAASKRVEHTFGTLRRNLYISSDLK